jgi:hypothetical protein
MQKKPVQGTPVTARLVMHHGLRALLQGSAVGALENCQLRVL